MKTPEKLIEIQNEYARQYVYASWTHFLMNATMDSLLEAMTVCATRYGSYMKEQGREEGLSGGWIAVSERLPDFNVEVLVFGERAGTNPKMGGAYVSMTKRIDLKGTSFESRSQRLQCDNQFSQMAYATHWMPLPATPQPTDTNP